MKFTKKSTFIKFDAEYESPSGDKYECAVCIESDKHTISWRKMTEDNQTDFITIDGDMLSGLYDMYQELVLKGKKNSDKGLPNPNIIDHRKVPIESLSSNQMSLNSEDSAAEFRTGININELGELPDTPENMRIDNDTEAPSWKKDVKQRLKRVNRQSFRDIV
jgi:hypothetical protein